MRLSLRERLLVLMAALVLPLAAVSLWSAARESRAAVELARSQLQLSASLLAANQNRSADAAEQLLGVLAAVRDWREGGEARCSTYFQALHERYNMYSNIGVAGVDGAVDCDAQPGRGLDIGDRDYFRAALEQRRFVMGEPIIGRVSRRRTLPFAMPLVDDAGRVTGVLFASLDLERAAEGLRAVALPPGARATVTDRQGRVLLAYGEELPQNDPDGLVAVAVKGRDIGDQGLRVEMAMRREAVTIRAEENQRDTVLVLAATLFAALAGGWWLGGQVIVQPARRILLAVRRIEQGRLDARVPTQGDAPLRGEFARIGGAFNVMAESLQQRQAALENELGRSRDAYDVLDVVLNSMQEGIIAVRPDGSLLLHNEAAAKLFAFEPFPAAAERAALNGLFDPQTGKPMADADLPLARALRGESGRLMPMLVRNTHVPDGRVLHCSYQPIRGEAGISGGLVVFADVTQLLRLQAEQAMQFAQIRELNANLEARIAQRTAELARQERMYRTLAEQAPQVVWNTDRDGAVLYLNRAWRKLVGGAPSDWLGYSWFKRVHPDDVPEVQSKWLHSQRTLEPYFGIRRILGEDGLWHTMSYRAAPVVDENGEVLSWVGIDADITELKAIETALRASNQELEAFSFSVSHDLRAPLAAIGGFSRALQGRLEGHPDERARHYLLRIQAGVDKMEEQIEAMLSLARVVRAPLHWGAVDLGAIARETFDALQAAEPARHVRFDVQGALWTRGDGRLLRIVLENLLGNAWKFTSRTQDARIEVGRSGEGATFYVRDNGAGFDMAYKDKLFTAFQRLHTEAEFPGTGIGLATVRRIVARHQGRVWAACEPGAGTTFWFALDEAAPPAWLTSA